MPWSLVLYLLSCQVLTDAFPAISTGDGLNPKTAFSIPALQESRNADGTYASQIASLQTKEADVAPLTNRGFALEVLGGGWEVIYEYFDSLLPLAVTTPVFSKFYGDVMGHILSIAGDIEPCNHFTITQGFLMLEFFNPSGEAIPWQVAYRFASNLLIRTAMGFTSTYDAVYYHDATNTRFGVKLGFIVNIASGVSEMTMTGSRSSSGSGN